MPEVTRVSSVVVEGRTKASALDQHWTPPDMVAILADHLGRRPLPSEGNVVEPFAGEGRIIRGLLSVIPAERWLAIEIDRRYSDALYALLGAEQVATADAWLYPWPGHIVTNPPFGRSMDDVLERVLAGFAHDLCGVVLMAHRVVCERAWMPAPSELLCPRWRPAFGGARGGLPGMCWAIWRPGHTGATETWFCDRPELAGQGVLL